MKEACCLAVCRQAGARDLIYDFLPLSCSPVCGIWLLMFQPCFDRILICVISVSDILQHSNVQRLPRPVGEATSEVMPPRESVSSGIFVLFRPWS